MQNAGVANSAFQIQLKSLRLKVGGFNLRMDNEKCAKLIFDVGNSRLPEVP